jgi:hypothetical protein
MPIECFACDQNHQNPLGTCQYDDPSSYCLSGDYSAAYANGGVGFHCTCEASASDCPGQTEVCAAAPTGLPVCITCGEITVEDLSGAKCKGTGTCAADAAACQ